MHWNLLDDEEFGSLKFLKLKYRRGDQIIQPFCRIGSPLEIRSPLFNLRKFEKTEKSTPESCKMHWNLLDDEEFGWLKFSKLKYRNGDQIIQPFCRIGSPQEISSPLFNLRKFEKTEKSTAESCRMHWNLLDDEEFEWLKLLKLKYRSGDQIIQPFCRIGFPQEISSPLFNLRKFEKTEKSTPESCRMHWNLLDDEEFGWLKFSKLKYRRGDQIIQPFCRIGSPQEISSPLFNLRKFEKTEKSTAESCRMHWNVLDDKEFGWLKFLKLKYRRGDQIIQPFCRIGSPQEIRSPLFNLRKFEKTEKSTAESCRMHWNLLDDEEFRWLKFPKLKCRRGDQIIQLLCRIGSPQEISSPLFNLRKFEKTEKITAQPCTMHWNLLDDEEFGSLKFLKLKYRRGDQIIQPFCRIGSPLEIRSPLFNLRKFEKTEKSTPESCKMHWNLLDDEEFGWLKFSKLKYRNGDQIIQPFCRIGSPQEISSPLFNLRKFEKTEKSTAESCRMHWNLLDNKEFGWLKFLKLNYRRGDQIIQPFCRIGSPQEIRSPLFNLRKFEKTEKITAEPCTMHWNLLDDEEFGSLKFLKLKYRRGDQIIPPFCRIGSPQEIRSSLFNLRKFEKTEKITAESCRMHWNLLDNEEFRWLKFSKLKYRRGDQIIQPFCRIGSPKKLGPPSLIWGNLKKLRKVLLNRVECIEIYWMTKNLDPSNF